MLTKNHHTSNKEFLNFHKFKMIINFPFINFQLSLMLDLNNIPNLIYFIIIYIPGLNYNIYWLNINYLVNFSLNINK